MKYLLPFIVLLCVYSAQAQVNHVPNCSFEQYTTCPTSSNQIASCTGWRKYTLGSVDYFNACVPVTNNVGVPTNFVGHQLPAHGSAYAGLLTYSNGTTSNYKEYLATAIQPLQVGAAYQVSIYVSMADATGVGTDDLGVFFYDNGPFNLLGTLTTLPYTPQVSYTSYGTITNKTGWTRLTGVFVADSAYDNMIIGGYTNYATMGKTFTPTGNATEGYYYIDSVVVAYEDTLAVNYDDSLLCGGASVTVPYYLKPGIFAANNIITLQLSDANGSFASPNNLGSAFANTSGSITVTVPTTISAGTAYRLRLTTTNPALISKPNVKPITISFAPPAAPVATANGPLCAGDTIKLGATNTSIITKWIWTGPNGFLSLQQNPKLPNSTVAMGGNYTVKTYNGGCFTTASVPVIVNTYPFALNAAANTPLCQGATLQLSASSAGTGFTYNWTGPLGYNAAALNSSIPNAVPTQSGDYVITATLNNCVGKDTVTVLVNPTPVTPTAGNSGTVCEGDSVVLSATTTNTGASFSWTGPGSFSSSLQNPTLTNVNAATNGVYSVTTTVNGCVSAPATTTVSIKPLPPVPVVTSSSPVCAGGVIALFASSIIGAYYSWTGPNGFTSTLQNPALSPAALNMAGTYSVTVDLNGCTSPGAGSTAVIVNNISSLGVYPSPNDTLCANNTNANFVAVPFNAGTAPQYQWYRNNTLVAGATNVSYPATGIADGDSFYCRMTVTGLCAGPLILYSNKVGMTVLPLTTGPSVSITADPGLLLSPWQLVKFTAIATNAGALPKYQWKRNNQDVIGAMSDNWSANNLSNGDTISCVVTSDVWCASPSSAVSNRMVVNIKTGIHDIDGNTGMKLYPNPNSGSFTVVVPDMEGASVQVVDVVGRTVYFSQSKINNHKLDITLPVTVSNGVYLLKLHADGVVYHARFTVSR